MIPVALIVLVAGTIAALLVRREIDPWRRLLAAADRLDSRVIEGRLAEPFHHKPLGSTVNQAPALQSIRAIAGEWQIQWQSIGSSQSGHVAGAALLISGQADQAFSILGEVLRRTTDETELPEAIQKSTDADVLTDFSAVALQESNNPRNLVLAYEAADRAWHLDGATSAAWNRAIAADRIGIHAAAAQAWREIKATERSPSWVAEAGERGQVAARLAGASPDSSFELFFYRELIVRTIAGKTLLDIVPSDHFAFDVTESLRRLHQADRSRLSAALRLYLRGRDAFERNDFEEARRAYAPAEAELAALDVPLFLIARDQRIRSECSQGKTGCIEEMRAFRRNVSESGRYPWLAARSAYGEGQVLYRNGRIYEAAQHLLRALTDFERLGDAASAGFMHILLANVFAAGGETDLALRHFLDGIRCHPPEILDRRRKMREDAIMFMLRHGYIATAELLLQDLATASTTPSSNVVEAMLRGVVAFRRGDAHSAASQFARGRALLSSVVDDASRADVQFRLAIAEAGSRTLSSNPIIAELDSSIAAHERTEYSVWLPQLLAARGSAYERVSDVSRAENDYRRAIDILESRGPQIDETVLALGIATTSESPFDRAIRLLLGQGRSVEALEIAQRTNSLRISSLNARGAGVRDAYRQSGDGGESSADDLQRTLQADQFAVALYMLRDELIVWIVDRGGVRTVRRPVASKDIARRIRRLGSRESQNGEDDVERLSDVLLRDWIDAVPRGDTLLIQPSGELESVPFSMLTTRSGERLVARNALATAPSFRAFVHASVKDAERAGPGATSAFFAAAPEPGDNFAPLPLARREVIAASRFYATAQIEPHATRAAFLERSPAFAVVHFAGHVAVNTARPLFSALVFEKGELLYVYELDKRSFVKARLVVLSGCETGRSPRPTMSVANALLSQNVPSVVYTLWPVSDDVAEEFAIALHRAIAVGQSRAGAVRNAQCALMAKWPNEPRRWAAFALAGTPGLPRDLMKGEAPWTPVNRTANTN